MTKAGDLCLSAAGARVILATSSDERHPAEHIMDGNPETFWTTTGMFPQEFIISLSGVFKINKITIHSSLVKNLRIETSISKEPVNFEPCTEKVLIFVYLLIYICFLLPQLSGIQAAHLRFVILSAYDHFVAVYSVSGDT
uniref:Intraflagellar transport protein 25 homolog n=1 Tax=Leptobrachium leishanense TaxID=445787 RepID=A0A8C5R651_9ANUR